MRSQEHTPSLKLIGTKETGFTLSINNCDNKNDISYHTTFKNIFSIVPNITKIFLHNGIISESIRTCFYQFLRRNQTLQEFTVDCRLILEQTENLSVSLNDNRTLKTLHMFNIWEINDELDGCENIFKMLRINRTLMEFALVCCTNRLRLDFDATRLIQNESHKLSRSAICQIYQNTNIELFENFLGSFPIQTPSFASISPHHETFL